MRRYYVLLPIFCLGFLVACGSGVNNPTNVGLFGNWNVTMYPTANQNAVYVFGIAMSQEGTTTYSGASIPYTGSVSPPANMCINANEMRATGTLNSNNQFTITFTDISSNTIINVTGTLQPNTTTVAGNYTNPASAACAASSGTMQMIPQ